MSDTLTPGVPAQVADLFESGEIHWQRGWGNRTTDTCLHGALLRPCAEPGDEIMWSILLAHRGLTIGWNDDQTTVTPIISRLREQGDPDEAEMVKVFGPNWRAARTICRTWAQATDKQRRAAWAAWEAREAREARAAWEAWEAWEAREAREAWAAWEAREAFCAVIGHPWLTDSTDPNAWNQANYDLLMEPWVSVFGPVEVTS